VASGKSIRNHRRHPMRLPLPLMTDAPTLVEPASVHLTDDPLVGSWAAVRWEYVGADGSRRADLADQGGAITLSMTAEDYVLSYALRDGPARSAAGGLRVVADEWIEFSPRSGSPERVSYRRSAQTLVLRSDASAWDFTGTGEEPAAFTAVLVRL
jgi:hypothetical protein